MTSYRDKRCEHCGIRYSIQMSGPGPYSDHDRYCPDCHKVVKDALKKVPVKVEQFWKEVDDPDVIEKALAERDRRVEEGLPQRVWPGLYDPEKSATMRNTGVSLDGVLYQITEWSDNREPMKVSMEMERNLKTGTEVPWRDLD